MKVKIRIISILAAVILASCIKDIVKDTDSMVSSEMPLAVPFKFTINVSLAEYVEELFEEDEEDRNYILKNFDDGTYYIEYRPEEAPEFNNDDFEIDLGFVNNTST